MSYQDDIADEAAEAAAHEEFFKTVTVHSFCDLCERQAHGTQERLEMCGWSFGNGEEWCPNHSEPLRVMTSIETLDHYRGILRESFKEAA